MLPSQRSRMEPSPTCHCCSSCMDGALRKGGQGHGRRGQMLGWGEGEWVVQPLEVRMQVSCRIGHKRWSSLGS